MSGVLSSLFLDPGSIFFIPFLLCAVLFTLVWLNVAQKKNLRESLKLLFASESWLTRDAAIDALCSLFMVLVVMKLVWPMQDWIVERVTHLELWKPFSGRTPGLNPVAGSLIATAIAMLAYDFGSYSMHRFMHRFDWLWRIHSFHHSARKLNFFTTYRQHLLEPVLLALARSTCSGLALMAFFLIFPSHAQVVTIFGLGAGFFVYMLTVNLHHSPIPVHYPPLLRKLFVSPHVHHIHHSLDPRHAGRNYGVIFSLWDIWFKTYHDENVGLNQLDFGSRRDSSQWRSATPRWAE